MTEIVDAIYEYVVTRGEVEPLTMFPIIAAQMRTNELSVKSAMWSMIDPDTPRRHRRLILTVGCTLVAWETDHA